MEIRLTPAAHEFLHEQGASAITVASVVFSSCCSAPLPPEAKPGPPADPDGFDVIETPAGVTVYFDSLLEPRHQITVDAKNYGRYRELFIAGWDETGRPRAD